MMYSFNNTDGYYNPNMSSSESPNTSNNSTRTSDSGFMDMSMVTPMVTPMATAMNSPCFPMPGQNYPIQQVPVQPFVPNGFEEALMAQAQAARAHVQAGAQAYFTWMMNHAMPHQPSSGSQAAPSRHQPHDLYSHPYALSQRHIQQAFQLADEERRGGGRVPFSAYQLTMLKERFAKSDGIRVEERRQLAQVIGLSEKQIKIWFQNRRFKLRKEAAAKLYMEQQQPLEKLMSYTKLEETNDH